MRNEKQYQYGDDFFQPRIELPKSLIGKTTKDIHPRDAMKFFPKRHDWKDGWRYVLTSLIPFPTPKGIMRSVREKIVAYLQFANKDNPERLKTDLKAFNDEVWPTLKKAMKHNLGMALLMDQYGYRSRFLPRAVTVGAQAVLLELFHSGRTKDISGNFEYIPYEDAMIEMIVWEPISLCMWERVAFTQQKILEICEKGDGGAVEVLSCGAGLVPEKRTNDFPQDSDMHITAVDFDSRNLTNLSLVYERPIEEYGIDYHIMDMVDYCNNPVHSGSKNIVIAMGVLSYHRRFGQTRKMIATLLKPLKSGGVLLCDVQLMNIHLIRCATAMGWKSDLFPDWTWWSAKLRLRLICWSLGVSVKFTRSRYLEHAAGINMAIYKPGMPLSHREKRHTS